jgi:hypothetical protein
MRFSQETLQVFVAAHEEAARRGQPSITPADQVLALLAGDGVAARALGSLGVTAEVLFPAEAEGVTAEVLFPAEAEGMTADALARHVGWESASRRSRAQVPLGAPAKAVVTRATLAAMGEQTLLTTGHLLLAVLDQPDDPATRALASLAGPEAIREAVARQQAVRAETPASTVAERLAQVRLGPAPRRPRRGAVAGGLALALLWYVACGALILTTGPDPVLAAVALLGFPVYVFGLTALLRGVTVRTAGRRMARGAGLVVELPAELTALLAGRGVTRLETRALTGPMVRNRCVRIGRWAWLVLAPATIKDDPALRFVLAHEIGHLVRNDSLGRRSRSLLAIGLVGAALIIGTGTAVVIALIGSFAMVVTGRWSAEFAADRIGVRWVGAADLVHWAAGHRALLAQPQNRTPRRRARRMVSWLSHPPLALRVARTGRLRSRSGPARSGMS